MKRCPRRALAVLCALAAAAGVLADAPGAQAAGAYHISMTQDAATLRARTINTVLADVRDANGVPAPDGTLVTFSATGGHVVSLDVVGMAAHGADGYWLVDSAGDVLPFGSAPFKGDLGATDLSGSVVGIAATPAGDGYWLATDDGKIYGFGDTTIGMMDTGLGGADPVIGITADGNGGWVYTAAGTVHAFGAAPALGGLNNGGADPVAGLVATDSGHGYFIFTAGGAVYPFGDGVFKGDMHATRLNRPVAGMITYGSGYLLMGNDGGIFDFSERPFAGSLGANPPASPVLGMVATPASQGYWMFTAAGTVFHFGNAQDGGDVFRLPTSNGRAAFVFTSLTAGGTIISADVPGASAGIAQTWTPPDGYWMLAADGAVFAFGGAPNLGNPTANLNGHAAVDLEPTPDAAGYWIVDDAGHVFPYGDAAPLGNASPGALTAGEKVTSLTATPTGHGYWVFTSTGRVLPFGDAAFLGDMSQVKLNGPVLGSVATPSGRGYYMVASDGGIFAFGDARFAGSMGGQHLNAPVQSLVPDPDAAGYWLVASDGGIFAFDAPFHGSMGATKLNKPISGMVPYGDGYLMVGADGGIFNFSSLPFSGSLGNRPPASPVVAVAALP